MSLLIWPEEAQQERGILDYNAHDTLETGLGRENGSASSNPANE